MHDKIRILEDEGARDGLIICSHYGVQLVLFWVETFTRFLSKHHSHVLEMKEFPESFFDYLVKHGVIPLR